MTITPLSEHEHEVLMMLARGYNYGEIALLRNVSVKTVKTQVYNAKFKMNARSVTEAVVRNMIPNMDPLVQAELIKEAARIDPTTGRLPENLGDPDCDHCGEQPWTTLIILTGEYTRSRRLCGNCTVELLEWV
jgi:DNA-binding CsgD family transcriptional regulator